MPTIDRATFVARMQGKQFKEADLKAAFPSVDVRGLANAHGVIEGTPANLEKLWKAIDKFDSDGNAATVSNQTPVNIAQWVLARAGAQPINPPSGGGPIPGMGNLPDNSAWKKVAEAGDKAIVDKTKAHHDAIDQIGIGRYYGDHGSFQGSVRSGDKDAIKAEIEASTNGKWTLASIGRGQVEIKSTDGAGKATLKESSCIGWVMENVKAAYEGAGKSARFAQIEERMRVADMRGTVLCEELQKDGWTAVFYSPRTAQDLKDSGENEKLGALNMAKAGSRVWRAVTVEGSKGVKCDAVITGYRDTTPDAKTEALLKRLESAPFLVGVANGGTHTFVGHKGSVCDFHWTAGPSDKGAMTESPVRQWQWDTGLYMVPPGFWKTSPTGDV